jgi:hypothetical protein
MNIPQDDMKVNMVRGIDLRSNDLLSMRQVAIIPKSLLLWHQERPRSL